MAQIPHGTVRTAWESFQMTRGSPYHKRTPIGLFWSKEEAERSAKNFHGTFGRLKVVRLNGKWYRVYATPLGLPEEPPPETEGDSK